MAQPRKPTISEQVQGMLQWLTEARPESSLGDFTRQNAERLDALRAQYNNNNPVPTSLTAPSTPAQTSQIAQQGSEVAGQQADLSGRALGQISDATVGTHLGIAGAPLAEREAAKRKDELAALGMDTDLKREALNKSLGLANQTLTGLWGSEGNILGRGMESRERIANRAFDLQDRQIGLVAKDQAFQNSFGGLLRQLAPVALGAAALKFL